jgi:hypothetical protein
MLTSSRKPLLSTVVRLTLYLWWKIKARLTVDTMAYGVQPILLPELLPIILPAQKVILVQVLIKDLNLKLLARD